MHLRRHLRAHKMSEEEISHALAALYGRGPRPERTLSQCPVCQKLVSDLNFYVLLLTRLLLLYLNVRIQEYSM